jgi:16S rRNA (cytosine1402-N4)-methyltransferase
MLPNALQPSTTDHVPVLADEVRRLLDVEPGETVVDATFGAGGHASLLAEDLRGRGGRGAVGPPPTRRPVVDSIPRPVGGRHTRRRPGGV